MVSTLDYLAGCKFGLDTGANRARDAFSWRCAQLVSVEAMRGVAEFYYRARRLRLQSPQATLVQWFRRDRTRLRYSGSADQFCTPATTISAAQRGIYRRTF